MSNNRLVRCQEFKILSIRFEIRNQHVEMHQIPSMEEKSATSSAKPLPVSLTTVFTSDFFGGTENRSLDMRLNKKKP